MQTTVGEVPLGREQLGDDESLRFAASRNVRTFLGPAGEPMPRSAGTVVQAAPATAGCQVGHVRRVSASDDDVDLIRAKGGRSPKRKRAAAVFPLSSICHRPTPARQPRTGLISSAETPSEIGGRTTTCLPAWSTVPSAHTLSPSKHQGAHARTLQKQRTLIDNWQRMHWLRTDIAQVRPRSAGATPDPSRQAGSPMFA